ncbi:hypothetical protein AAK913_12030 [Enterococcus faecium]|jgi:hypothetical protein|uniref:hypothetical protein n=1 Tax=Enterococcus faecium TaxID=1352 RepID=UPI001F3F9A23|nr:hypothetical protein [Enterococcus faecium]EKZ0201710.1 hypothetical protein [Enterococcus faecalis]MCF8636727.1 hypothetical protein [Enterococcus faecium]
MVKNKTAIKVFILLLTITFSVVGALVVRSSIHNKSELEKQEVLLDKKLNVTKKEYTNHKKEVEESAYKEAISSDNPKIKDVAVYNSAFKLLNEVSERFFKEYFTWRSSEDYQKRADNLGDFISKELKENKKIFDDGRDTTGGDYISSMGVKSDFKDAKAFLQDNGNENIINALVLVEYESWFNDSKDASSIGEKYYNITYDKSLNQVTHLELVFSKK